MTGWTQLGCHSSHAREKKTQVALLECHQTFLPSSHALPVLSHPAGLPSVRGEELLVRAIVRFWGKTNCFYLTSCIRDSAPGKYLILAKTRKSYQTLSSFLMHVVTLASMCKKNGVARKAKLGGDASISFGAIRQKIKRMGAFSLPECSVS